MTVDTSPAVLSARSISSDSIVLDSVVKYYGSKLILDHVSHTVEAGSFVSLIGPSGCGKSTLLRMIGDLEPLSSGAIEVGAGSPESARRDHSMSMVFQAPNLVPWRSVRRNVELPLEAMGLAGERVQGQVIQLVRHKRFEPLGILAVPVAIRLQLQFEHEDAVPCAMPAQAILARLTRGRILAD